jgi:DNA invertase Pin-like site-specific DNA recombinase
MVLGTDVLVGYARVSTLDQNPQLQIDALKQAGCERLYVERASGAHRDRPELKAALEYMRPGDTLVVWRLSRLARSLKQIIETAHDLEQKKQALRVLTRNIDTGTPEGRLFFHITAAFDEFQRELIVENTRAGLFRGSQKAGTQRRAAASFGQGQDSRRRGNAQGYRELSICRGCHRPPPDR